MQRTTREGGMRTMRSRRVIGFGMLALLLAGVGAGAALARTQSPAGVSSAGTSASASDAAGWRGRFLDDAARRLGVSRSKLDAALEAAMRRSARLGLDRWVKAGVITKGQESALLGRFSSEVGDLVNGIPPSVSELAGRLGLDRAVVVSAIQGAAIDQVQAARKRGLLTRSQAAFITHR